MSNSMPTRDAGAIDYAEVIVYEPGNTERLLGLASGTDLIIKLSGVGAEDALLE